MIRSCLYVPGNRPDRLQGALTRGADVLIADLEDAVAPADKAAARAAVAEWLGGLSDPASQPWVRVNSDNLDEDIEAVVHPSLAGLVLPKSEDPATIEHVAALLTRLEDERGMADGSVQLALLIESGAGILNAAQLATAPRVSRLQIGEADLSADLGVTAGPEGTELLWARSHVVLASAAAGLPGPVGPVWTAIDDIDGLRASCVSLKNLGFRARSVIHPKHLAVVHEVFTPSAAELEQARALVELFDAALRDGLGVIRDSSGTMIDEAMVRHARSLLEGSGAAS